MKKIFKLLSAAALVAGLASCDFNEVNFPGYDDQVAPKNKFAYTDSVTEADMATISKLALKEAKTAADSAKAKALGTNKYFHDVDAPAADYIPLWLATKYKYGDVKSSVTVVSPQYIAEEGELQYVKEKYVQDSTRKFKLYNAEIFSEPFLTSLGTFTAISVTGDQKWAWSSYKGDGFAKISGYSNGNKDNEDWLISPAIDMSKRTEALLLFDNTHKFGTVSTKEMTVWVCRDWDGVSTDTLQWTRKMFTYSTTNDYTFVSSGAISLTEFAGKSNVRVAFRYLSNSKESAPTWEVKNVRLLESLEE